MVDQMECKVNGCGANISLPVGKPAVVCPECRTLNCVSCQAVHEGVPCSVYRQKLQGSNKRTEKGSAELTAVTPVAPNELSPRKSTALVEAPEEILVECKVTNCVGHAFVGKDAEMFRCPVCEYFTCLKCMAVHQSLTCAQYKANKDGIPSPVYKPPKQPKGDQDDSNSETDGEDEQKVDDEAEGRIVDCCYGGGCGGSAYVEKTATLAQCEKCNHWTCIACKASHESQSCAVYKGIEEPPQDEHLEYQALNSKHPKGDRPKRQKDGRNGASSGKTEGNVMSRLAGAMGSFFGKTVEEVPEGMQGPHFHGANGFGQRVTGYGRYQEPYEYKKVQTSEDDFDSERGIFCGSDVNRPSAQSSATTPINMCDACASPKSKHVFKSCEHNLCRHCILNALKTRTLREFVRCPGKVKHVGRCSGFMHIAEIEQFASKEELKNINKDSKWQHVTCFNPQCGVPLEKRKGARKYNCPACSLSNCSDCQANHEGMSCEEHIRKFVDDLDAGRLEDSREKQKRFEEQIQLYEQDCVLTTRIFDCSICYVQVQPGEGILLRNCHHEICKQCLADSAKNSPSAEVKCPLLCDDNPCEMPVLDTDIRACLSAEDYEALQERGLREAENSSKEPSFHCKTPDCKGWCVYTREAQVFDCPICNQQNCLGCEAIHKDMNCADYQADLKRRAENDSAARASLNFLEELLKSGQAMRCPQCRVVIIKRSGCDYMVCTSCKTQLCWATKGARWGPNGPGDTSGGCRCGVNGLKCHPTCNFCH